MKFKVGDKVKLNPNFYAAHVETYGVMEIWKIEKVENPFNPLSGDGKIEFHIFVKGGNTDIQEATRWSLYDDGFILVGPRNKITVNTRRKW